MSLPTRPMMSRVALFLEIRIYPPYKSYAVGVPATGVSSPYHWLDLNVASLHFYLAQGYNRNFVTWTSLTSVQIATHPFFDGVHPRRAACMFRFRAFRKCWLAAIAVVSLACIAISPSLYRYYQSKSDLCVLIAIPGLCLTASITAIFAKRFFPSTSVPTSVAVECIWTTCFVIFNLILSLYSLGVEGDVKNTNARTPFRLVEVCCWSLTGLMATYASLIMMLSILTAATVDKDVWFRDIAGSPSPFPLAVCLYSTKLWFTDTGISSNTREHPHCLPRCSCKEKISPSSPSIALPPLGIVSDHRLDGCANARSIVPGVRVPTVLERHNSIFVGLEV